VGRQVRRRTIQPADQNVGRGRIYATIALRAQWADAAMGRGGLVELREALVDRLLRVAHGADVADWRKNWIGHISAAYAARYDQAGAASFVHPPDLSNVRTLLIDRSRIMPAYRSPAHPARQTLFCVLWLVIYGLECPRTAPQVLAMLVRLAALVRVYNVMRVSSTAQS
jgi:hypothetical protein